jgi:hypothetical protein
MLTHVPALVQASEMLLKGFLEDPSAWGVSTTFMACEDELEATMVSWCAVAGTFFTDGDDTESGGLTGRWRLHKSGTMSGSQTLVSSPSSPVTRQSSVLVSPQLPSVSSLMNSANRRIKEGQRIGEESWWTGGNVLADSESQALSPRKLESGNGRELNNQPSSRRFSVRDLAIQPTQRVMRYVLLYRGMLTPFLSLLDSDLLACL